jgi:hypothetical protein
MSDFDYQRAVILKAMPEDIKRFFIREIDRCKKGNLFAHYQFVYHLLTHYTAVMDIFNAAESTPSEIEYVKKTYDYFSNEMEAGKNLVWICPACKNVLGLFNAPSGYEKSYSEYLSVLIKDCPSCGDKGNYILRSSFLLSGLSLEQAFGKEEPEKNVEACGIEMMYIMEIMSLRNESLKKFFERDRLLHSRTIKDLLKEGCIQNMVFKNKEGNAFWNIFGKIDDGKN